MKIVVRRLTEALNERRKPLNGSRVLLLGLAYKRNTGDARESPARRVVELLLGLGAEVSAVDPHVVEAHVDPQVRRTTLTAQELKNADAVVLITDHDEFDLDLVSQHSQFVLDCRNVVPASPVVEVL